MATDGDGGGNFRTKMEGTHHFVGVVTWFLHVFNLFLALGVGAFDVSAVRVMRDPGAGTTLQLMLSPPTRHLRAHVPMEPERYETAMRCSQPRVSILVQLESQKYVVQGI